MTIRHYSEDDSRVVLNEMFWDLLRETQPAIRLAASPRLASMEQVKELFERNQYVYVRASDEEEREAYENGSEFSPGTHKVSDTWLYDAFSELYVADEDTSIFGRSNELLTFMETLELEFFRWLDGPYVEEQGEVTDEQLLNGIGDNFSRDFNLTVGRQLIKTYLKENESRVYEMYGMMEENAIY